MYSDFYEIPLPALRFEKVEETDTKKWKRHQRETTLKEKQIHSQENDTQRTNSTTLKPGQNRGSEDKKIEAPFIREIKLTHSKNGRH